MSEREHRDPQDIDNQIDLNSSSGDSSSGVSLAHPQGGRLRWLVPIGLAAAVFAGAQYYNSHYPSFDYFLFDMKVRAGIIPANVNTGGEISIETGLNEAPDTTPK